MSGKPSFAIIDKGRSKDERSCIWVENGHFYGMGYISSDIGFTQAHEIKEYVTPYNSNQYIMQLIYSYAEKYPSKLIKHDGIIDY
jgi:DNA polymerase-3 subunit epsilon